MFRLRTRIRMFVPLMFLESSMAILFLSQELILYLQSNSRSQAITILGMIHCFVIPSMLLPRAYCLAEAGLLLKMAFSIGQF